jgi:hypothetical protein
VFFIDSETFRFDGSRIAPIKRNIYKILSCFGDSVDVLCDDGEIYEIEKNMIQEEA